MKVIRIFSDEEADYAVEDFLRSSILPSEAFEHAQKCLDNKWEFRKGAYVEAITFAYCNITKDFEDFVKQTIGDVTMMKHETFIVV